MTIDRSENNQIGEVSVKLHPYMFRFVVVFGMLLLLAPLLPGFVSNVVYAFSGEKPKIYWYLSRAAGFVALSILWVSMAMGLTITNKLARRWPGTPAAFAVHQYVSLLGLAFSVYHGLVLMGDHFVDFSLPRLATPFSIAYERFWVGLGQLGFYVWVIVVLSFYVRKFIGQKTWRLIHYANFVMYAMGLFHGVFSGTESKVGWAQWYYWISGLSLLTLVAYRVHQARSKPEAATTNKPKPQMQRPQQETPRSTPIPATGSAENSPVGPSSEHVAVPATEAAKEITKPTPATQLQEAKTSGAVPPPAALQESEQKPSPEKVETKEQEPMNSAPPKPSRATPIEKSAAVLRIQKLFDEIRPPKPLPEKPIEMPALRIRMDQLVEQVRAESPWDKVAMEKLQSRPEAKTTQVPPSRLLMRLKENLPQSAESSALRIRPRKTIISEDDGNV